MERRILEPEQVILPAETDLVVPILQVYFRAFEGGYGEAVPPVLVASPRHFDYGGSEFLPLQEKIKGYGDALVLIDGKHRALAATLSRKEIRALEMETDEDLILAGVMAEAGVINGFNRKEGLLQEVVHAFYYFCMKRDLELTETARERAERLAESEDLPRYIIERYRKSRVQV